MIFGKKINNPKITDKIALIKTAPAIISFIAPNSGLLSNEISSTNSSIAVFTASNITTAKMIEIINKNSNFEIFKNHDSSRPIKLIKK